MVAISFLTQVRRKNKNEKAKVTGVRCGVLTHKAVKSRLCPDCGLHVCVCLMCCRSHTAEQGGTSGTSGPIIRTAKTSRSGGADMPDYDDAVVLMDCTPFWRRIGVHWPACHRLWFVKDVCGVICAIFTWGLIFYAEYVIMFVVLLPAPNSVHSFVNGVFFQTCSFLAIASHLKTMLTDPVSRSLLH